MSTHVSGSLRRGFAWASIGNIAYGLAQWGTVVILAKSGTPEMLGQFALALALTAPVIMFSNLGLRIMVAMDVAERYPFGVYFSVRLLMLAGSLGLIGGGVMLSNYRLEFCVIVLMVAVSKAFESVSDLLIGVMQRAHRMDRVAFSFITKGAASMAAMWLGMLLTDDLLWATVLLVFSWGLSLLVFDVPTARACLIAWHNTRWTLKPIWDAASVREVALCAFPLGLSTLLGSAIVYLPRYIVGEQYGDRDLGYFAAMTFIPIVGARICQSFHDAAIPRLSKHYENREARSYVRLNIAMALFGATVGGIGVLMSFTVGAEILSFLYEPEYSQRMDVFHWLMISAGLGYVAALLEGGVLAGKRFGATTMILLSAGLVLVAGCVLLTPRYGLVGVAMAMAACTFTQLIGRTYVVWKLATALHK